ncbi:MAG TPA: cytochrome c oxidase assembly protein [Acidimicrobiia bacterium]|nr:cytochrome c oxidase assembly protein [Acidimicrobiia bacterium]
MIAHGGHAHTPSWVPHPDVWLLVALLAVGYALVVWRLGPRHSAAGQRAVTPFQVTCWYLGVAAVWVAADWPIHDVAEGFNYSVHMVQHLLLSMVATPLLVLGTPAWMLRAVLRPPAVFRLVRTLARFFPALLMFNVVLVLTHWPAVVDLSLRAALPHFLVHALIFVSALIVWLPVLSPLPEIPRLSPPGRMIFLFLQSVVPTVPASFLTFGSAPLYKFYEDVPQLWGLSTLDDQRLAGLIMKIGAGLLLWLLIAVIFFRWAADEERGHAARRSWQDLDREITRMSKEPIRP